MDEPKVGEKWYVSNSVNGTLDIGTIKAYAFTGDLVAEIPVKRYGSTTVEPMTYLVKKKDAIAKVPDEPVIIYFSQETRKKRYWLRFWRNW